MGVGAEVFVEEGRATSGKPAPWLLPLLSIFAAADEVTAAHTTSAVPVTILEIGVLSSFAAIAPPLQTQLQHLHFDQLEASQLVEFNLHRQPCFSWGSQCQIGA